MLNINTFLENFGLNEKEIAVYLAGLKLGPVRASFLSRKTGFTRQHIYDMLKSLEQKGFISRLGKDYGQRFIMEDPQSLGGILDKKTRQIEKLKINLNKLMPEFDSFYNVKGSIPKIKFFEEVDGIKEVFEDMLRCQSKKHFYFGSFADLINVLGDKYMDEWIERRIKKEIFSQALRVKDKERPEEIYSGEKSFLREIKYLPDNFQLTQTLVLYDNKVAIISSKEEHVGFIIESKEFFSTMENFFKLIWNISNK